MQTEQARQIGEGVVDDGMRGTESGERADVSDVHGGHVHALLQRSDAVVGWQVPVSVAMPSFADSVLFVLVAAVPVSVCAHVYPLPCPPPQSLPRAQPPHHSHPWQ